MAFAAIVGWVLLALIVSIVGVSCLRISRNN